MSQKHNSKTYFGEALKNLGLDSLKERKSILSNRCQSDIKKDTKKNINARTVKMDLNISIISTRNNILRCLLQEVNINSFYGKAIFKFSIRIRTREEIYSQIYPFA